MILWNSSSQDGDVENLAWLVHKRAMSSKNKTAAAQVWHPSVWTSQQFSLSGKSNMFFTKWSTVASNSSNDSRTSPIMNYRNFFTRCACSSPPLSVRAELKICFCRQLSNSSPGLVLLPNTRGRYECVQCVNFQLPLLSRNTAVWSDLLLSWRSFLLNSCRCDWSETYTTHYWPSYCVNLQTAASGTCAKSRHLSHVLTDGQSSDTTRQIPPARRLQRVLLGCIGWNVVLESPGCSTNSMETCHVAPVFFVFSDFPFLLQE